MDNADFNICFISDKRFTGFVVVKIDKGFNAQCHCFAVFCDLLVKNPQTIKIHEDLGSFQQEEHMR